MRHGLMVCLVALCLAGAVSGCDWGGGTDTEGSSSGLPTASRPPTPTVESSLEGLTALPARIRWTASTSLPPVQVKNVFFLVDGDRWWGDSTPPYTFGPPGAYLPVRWVSSLPSRATGHSGRTHEFAILVVTTAGDKWKSEPVRARTPPRAHVRPPGFGRFGRDYFRLSAAEIANPRPPGQRAGHGFMIFRASSLFVASPGGRHSYGPCEHAKTSPFA